jgi:transcription elongation factor Elf1
MSKALPRMFRCPKCGAKYSPGRVGTSLKYMSVECLNIVKKGIDGNCGYFQSSTSRNEAVKLWNKASVAKWGNEA